MCSASKQILVDRLQIIVQIPYQQHQKDNLSFTDHTSRVKLIKIPLNNKVALGLGAHSGECVKQGEQHTAIDGYLKISE